DGHRKLADLHLCYRVGDIGRIGEHIGRGALCDAKRLDSKVGVKLLAVAQKQRNRPHDRCGTAGIEADMAKAGGVCLKLRSQRRRRLDTGRGAEWAFSGKRKSRLYGRAVASFIRQSKA